jgi:ribosomal protein S4
MIAFSFAKLQKMSAKNSRDLQRYGKKKKKKEKKHQQHLREDHTLFFTQNTPGFRQEIVDNVGSTFKKKKKKKNPQENTWNAIIGWKIHKTTL